ncbi:hypothetical protein [Hymenobacter nivis]|uniref:Acyl-CoA dehydrogenase/oxidase N-terminal domain-containing protein n=1 Tax=Hymenobacter nivis TaxID=1850093 RepID=A0A2Z3GSM2_9BACT|nr:hypothetical protein [Hymenobacter nivis]AWM34687.1 hypothetical protein DDQ68_19055 [Hymenobacter nivis]
MVADFIPANSPAITNPDLPLLTMPAAAVQVARALVPRLFAQATATDAAATFPAQEFDWLRAAGLLTAAGAAGLGPPPPPRSC